MLHSCSLSRVVALGDASQPAPLVSSGGGPKKPFRSPPFSREFGSARTPRQCFSACDERRARRPL